MAEIDLIQSRKERLLALRKKGIEPFSRSVVPQDMARDLKEKYQEGRSVSVAGRITAWRGHGKVVFFDVRDSSDRIQIYVRKNDVGDAVWDLLGLLDIGDIVWVKGRLFVTKTGEITIGLEEIKLLTKSIRPLPEKWHGLKDVEVRFRQRYLDLIANPENREVFVKRARIISSIRRFLDERGYLEVETPMLHPIPGGAAGRPFVTHHNAYDIDLYLRIAPELYLKRLLVGGFDRIYEINRSFRNEGVSTRHNPEFTMLEVYTAYMDYEGVMRLTEEMLYYVVKEVNGSAVVEYQGQQIDFTPPWDRISFAQAVKDRFDINPDDPTEVMIQKLPKRGIGNLDTSRLSRSQVVKLVEDLLDIEKQRKPVFFTDYFSILCPLACLKKDNPSLAERFELFIGGMELANAYSELTDPEDQLVRFEEEVRQNNAPTENIDYDFVTALEYGMPPAGGLGVGIDRLAMILTNRPSIREVILFPLLKPERESV